MIYIKFFESIAAVFLMIVVGFLATYFGKINKKDIHAFSEVIFYITSPAIILYSIPEHFTKETMLSSFLVPLFAILTVLLTLVLAKFSLKIFNIRDSAKSDIFCLTTSFSNTVFLGLPIIYALYGGQAVGYVFFYDLGTGILFWTIGIALASRKGKAIENTGFQDVLTHIINPSLLALFFSIILVFFDKKLPLIIMQPAKMLGDVTIPLAMLIIGANIANLNFSGQAKEILLWPAILIKLLIVPILIGILLYYINISHLIKRIIIIEAAMPSMISATILSQKYKKLPDFSAKIVVTTTALSVVTIPFIVYLIELFY